MSLYPAPVLHNNALNSVFNSSDFTTTNKLNSTNVLGPLTVSGLATFNGGTQVNASGTVSGTLTVGGLFTANGSVNMAASSTLTLPSTQAITSSVALVDTGSTQTISGAKTFSTSLKTPMNTIINSTNDVADIANTQYSDDCWGENVFYFTENSTQYCNKFI